jgi:hypothetical protein
MAKGADNGSRTDGASAGGASPDTERIEQLFEQWTQRLGRFLAGAAARAREEAEDILAEAQSIRRGERD